VIEPEEARMEMDGARLAELLTALSVVTDLGIGRPPETAMRACLLATRLATEMGLGGAVASDVYYATLLRYIGCTAYAHEEAAVAGGDELTARAETTRTDFPDPPEVPGLEHLIPSHCEVGMSLAHRLGMTAPVQAALGQIFERWDGHGGPGGLKGEELCLPVRFAHVATQAMAFLPEGYDRVRAILRERSGGWFDPAIATALLLRGETLMAEITEVDAWRAAVEAEPEPRRRIADAALDEVAAAFADLTDLKTHFTLGHSRAVAALAEAAALRVGLPPAETRNLRRAALFHDLGQVGVANGIWEKAGALSAIEWEAVRLHPYHTERILSRAPALRPLALIAGMHHERQDGSGYFRAARDPLLPPAVRLLCAAEAYQAMTQERPHRRALVLDAAAETLAAEARAGRLDGDAVRAVLAVAGHRAARARAGGPAGLTVRELEVLRLIATGSSYGDVAQALVISARTAAHHVQHIYDKVGVSSRAAAALFAMEHQLL